MTLAVPLAGSHGAVDGGSTLGALGDDLARLAGFFELPVPDGFVITTEAFRRRAEIDLPTLLCEQVAALEQRTGRSFGCGAPPLLVAVRPSAIVEVPGLVLPVLDLGTCSVAHEGLVGFAGERFRIVYLQLDSTGHILELIQYKVHPGEPLPLATNRPGCAHVCFLVGDLRALHRRLTAQGAHFVSEPIPITQGVNKGGFAVYLRDPDGITIELLQRAVS